MQSEPGDEDAMNFDPNMESLWEAQDKLVAALDPAEQEHYLRRLDMQRQGKLLNMSSDFFLIARSNILQCFSENSYM